MLDAKGVDFSKILTRYDVALEVNDSPEELALTNKQLDTLNSIIKTLEGLTDKIVEFCGKEYKDSVPNYNPKNYDL